MKALQVQVLSSSQRTEKVLRVRTFVFLKGLSATVIYSKYRKGSDHKVVVLLASQLTGMGLRVILSSCQHTGRGHKMFVLSSCQRKTIGLKGQTF